MQQPDDSSLLRQYAENRSDDAFAALVARHINLVYSVALRHVSDPHQAEEVAQAVFVILAKKAAQLRHEKALSSWLFQVTRLTASNFMRGETRRHRREQEAHMRSVLSESGSDIWPNIAPLLDEAVAGLSEKDRLAIVLRFYEGRNLREVGAVLGASEDAAEKRVSRAVEKLRKFFTQHGVTVGASGLVIAISAHAVQSAPVELAATISTTAALAGTTLATSTTAAATKAIAMTTLQKTILGATLVAAVSTGVFEARQASRLRDENQKLIAVQDQLDSERDAAVTRLAMGATKPPLRLPAPRMTLAATPAESTPDDLQSTNLILRLLRSDKPLQLSPGQVESYLKENRRSAASLLAAYRATGDPTLLQEAMQKYPDDPQVAFAAVQRKDASPEERRQWLETLKKSSPENALGNYLSAQDYFKAGQTDQAAQELIVASGKQQFQDFSLGFIQDSEDAFRAAGYSEAEAKVIASISLWLPQLAQLKQLNQNMVDLAKSYQQVGDETSAQAVLQMDVNLGQRLGDSGGYFLINQLVGNAIERTALGAMDATSPYGNSGGTVKDRIDQLAQQNTAVKELAQGVEGLQEKISAQDRISYLDRSRNFGEVTAAQWLLSKYGQK